MSEVVVITNLIQLDALVAERVLGLQVRRDGNTYYCPKDNGGFFVPQFSSDMSAAWQVVEYLASNELTIEIAHKFQATGVNIRRQTKQPKEMLVNKSAPIAICLAALRFLEVEVELLEGVL